MKNYALTIAMFALLAGGAKAADWPDAVVLCAPVTCAGCGSAYIRAGTPPLEKRFRFETAASAKQVCDKTAELAGGVGLTTTRVSDAKLVIHGKIDSLSVPTNQDPFLPPATCTKPDAFPVATMLAGKEFNPVRRRRTLDAFNLRWAVEENWNELVLVGRVTDQRVTVLGKWKDCFFSFSEMPIERYFELLRD